MDLLDKLRAIARRVAPFEDAGLHPGHTVIGDVYGPCEVSIAGRPTLMFGSNNYLGLTFHPDVIAAARDALGRYGTGTTGSRAANGTLTLHEALERDLARRFGKSHGMVFTTGYQANVSMISGLCGPDDVVLVDVDSHASIFDGARLAGAQVIAYRHNSPDNLVKRMARLPAGPRNRLVVAEGLYSVYGDFAPLREIAAVCREHNAYLMVDEAHSFGVLGARGLGLCEDQGVLDAVDFIVGTFSKSLAGVGGFCVSNHAELKLLHFAARSYVFTASGSPANVAAVLAALEALDREPERRERLWANICRFRAGLGALGYAIAAEPSPIVPIVVGEEDRTIAVWQRLLDEGVYVNLIVPPACRQDRCVLRASCSAAHSDAHIDAALGAFAAARSIAGLAPAMA